MGHHLGPDKAIDEIVANGIDQADFDAMLLVAPVGGLQITAELNAGVTPVNYFYPPGNPYRYGASGNGVTDDTVALNNWAKVPGFHSQLQSLDPWLCGGALLALWLFETGQAKAGRVTPLAAYLARLS